MKDRPLTVKLTLVFVLLNAIIWLAFGLTIGLGIHPAMPDQPLIRWGMAILSLAAFAFLLIMFFALGKPNRIAFYLTLVFFIVSSLLTIFDDFGLLDALVLIMNIIPLILLIKQRTWYLE